MPYFYMSISSGFCALFGTGQASTLVLHHSVRSFVCVKIHDIYSPQFEMDLVRGESHVAERRLRPFSPGAQPPVFISVTSSRALPACTS